MNVGLAFHRVCQQLHSWSRHFKTRRAYCAISLLNYSADLILISWMFASTSLFLDVLFCLSSALIGISITGLYLKRPSVMLPDVIYKVVVSACALFNAILDADNGESGAGPRFLMVFIALLSHIYENYFLFNAIAAFYREQEGIDTSRPPPYYNLFAKSVPANVINQTKPASLPSASSIEEGQGTSTAENSGKIEQDEGNKHGGEERCPTPPPTYELAIWRMKQMKENGEKNNIA